MSYFFQGFPTILHDVYNNKKLIETVDIFRAVRVKRSMRDDVLLYKTYNIQDNERPDHVSMKLYGSTDYYWTFFMINENLVNSNLDWPLGRLELQNKIDITYSGNVLTTTVDKNISTLFIKNEILRGFLSGATAYIKEKDTNLGMIKIESISGTFIDGELIIGLTSMDTVEISGQRPHKDVIHHYETVDGKIVTRSTFGGLPITNSEVEIANNEKKSIIKVIRPEYIQRLSDEFFNQINPEEQ